jgi:hypothetical protein
MSNFICDICSTKFNRRSHLDYHIKHNACKYGVFRCCFCMKGYTTNASMLRHSNTSCKVHKKETKKKEEILEVLVRDKEKTDEHLKLLLDANTKLAEEFKKDREKIRQELYFFKEENKKEIILLRGENQALKKQVIKLEKKTNINNRQTINNTNNGLINNNNVILVAYGKEDMGKIDQKEILKALHDGFFSSVSLTKSVHFNPKYPEYHNVFISNIKNRYAMMYIDGKWTLTLKGNLINQLYEDKKSFIEENFEEFVKSLPESRKRALHKWLEADDEDQKVKDIKEQLKLLLYNSRDVIDDNVKIASMLMPTRSTKTLKKEETT